MSYRLPNQYAPLGFQLPNLDRATYFRLKELAERQGINHHGLVTIAINLLYEVIEDKQDSPYRDEIVARIRNVQLTTGVKRRDPNT